MELIQEPVGYHILKVIHVLMAIVWVGGAVMSQILISRLRSDPPRMVKTAGDIEWFGTHIFLPSSLILLAMGLWMVLGFDFYELTTGWILIGLIGIVITIITGAGYLGPQTKKLNAAVEEKGVDDPGVVAQIEKLFKVSRIDLVVLIIVVLAMVLKPTF